MGANRIRRSTPHPIKTFQKNRITSIDKKNRAISITGKRGLKGKRNFALIGQEIGADWARFFNQEYVLKPDVEIQLVEWESDFHRNQYNQASGFKKQL